MLLGSTALDVAIGLIFVYLVISLVCSSFSEGLESIFKHRSRDLERGIREMLSDTTPGKESSSDFVRLFYNHPLVSGLFKEDYLSAKAKRELPSYIPSRNFALALMDLVGSRGKNAVSGTWNATAPLLTPPVENPLIPLRRAACDFAEENPKVSVAMVALIDAAGSDATQARQNIENWFNSSMDRVSGWYKHRAQIIIFSVGLALSAIANVDSLAIIRTLSTDSGVRDALIAQAKDHSDANKTPAAESPVDRLRHLGLQLGWDPDASGSVPVTFAGWLMKVVGICLTALAVSLGAPFWFDMLNTFVVVRSTVKPAEKSVPEKSKQ